jgi:hypothetical protein
VARAKPKTTTATMTAVQNERHDYIMSDFQIEIDRTTPRIERKYVACLNVTIGECRIYAGLREDGRLQFLRVSRFLAICGEVSSELRIGWCSRRWPAEMWSGRRADGEIGINTVIRGCVR